MTTGLVAAEWTVCRTDAGAVDVPPGPEVVRYPARVPGTVAEALRDAGHPVPAADDLDGADWWFETTLTVTAEATRLEFDSVATVAEVLVDGERRASSTSMFVPVVVDLREFAGRTVSVAVCCRALTPSLRRRPRGRWRSSMIAQQGLRWVRTTMLGRAPVFAGAPVPVGIVRDVHLVPATPRLHVRGRVVDGRCEIHVTGHAEADVTVAIGGDRYPVAVNPSGAVDAVVEVGERERWWPHTHGRPVLHDVTVESAGTRVTTRVGFRSVEFDPPRAGEALRVNGIVVHARGGCWVPLDPVSLRTDSAALEATLDDAIASGTNLIRLTGTMLYETPEFHARCAERGVMVWQDVMLATVDPPDDDDHAAQVVAEIHAALASSGPATVVVSGGSETYQQPTMLGLAADDARIPLLDTVIPDLLASSYPDLAYVPSSPSGGDLPTHGRAGVAHWFGVGGYLRPLSDVRTAGVRFAAESLAFAIPPERRAVDTHFGSAHPAGHDPRWKAAVPRDRGSSWDFEDVRDHYVRTLFGVEPSLVRRDDPERYLDYGRAAVCEATAAVLGHWRRPDSECGGALVLTLRDLMPGAGWGFIDSDGGVKAPWYVLRRVHAPTTVLVSDEGMDGLTVHVVHDGPDPLRAAVEVRAVGRTGTVVADGTWPVDLPGHGSAGTSVDAILGRFTDATHAHRFGPPVADAVVVNLVQDGRTLARSVTLVGAPALPVQNSVGLSAAVEPSEDGAWRLEITAESAAQHVCVDVDGFRPSDNWFHLAPGVPHTVTLVPTGRASAPRGHVRAINSLTRAAIKPA
ncbi:glycosyl hydrolase 2 galactose-binding domain-containing protein [Rhodococcoides corynebacterioides]|uniref:beta-mannosidase n=1 Tax=Rhodococcoides corynebacterioides TaxID=53972 RepID=A0ABS7P6S1_9NOCA|nr:glycoside hydrolase family 2 protein [Rhodococcus corynebacterioides]MBY6368098.1 beta-mannosidase [Rhodococcus corynebacterioides]MBY6406518.1 beta-mannosidase [Rhodococcus corynebacterioides]